MRRLLLGTFAWKALLYLVVAVVFGGLTQDHTVALVLTCGFVVGDGSVAVLLRTPPPSPSHRSEVPPPG